MRHIFHFLGVVVGIVGLMTVAVSPLQAATEHIENFDSHILVNPNGSITITETIEYIPPYEKHGIFRYIPFQYPQPPFVYTTPIRNVSVSLDNGLSHPYESSQEDGNLTLKIGDPNATFNTPRTYVIEYTVQRAVEEVDGRPELYWDITGEGWPFPIYASQAVVEVPGAEVVAVECYSGEFGSDDGLCQFSQEDQIVTFTYPDTISYGENMTIALAFDPNGDWQLGNTTTDRLNWLWDNWLVFAIPLPVLIMAWLWYTRGRDYVYYTEPIIPGEDKPFRMMGLFEGRRVPFVYEPLGEATPGQAGVMLDEKVNNQDVIAEILDLARKRYLKIEGVYKDESARQKGKAKDYLFKKLKDADDSLPDYQEYLLTQIFKTGKDERKLSNMKGSFYIAFEATKDKLYKSVKTKKWFAHNPNTARGLGISAAVTLNIIAFVATIFYVTITQWPLWIGLFLIQVIPSFIFAFNLPQKTALGSAIMSRARGLRQSIQYGKWRERIKEKRMFIDEVLPFAIATGVIDQLTKDMKDLNLPEPDYVAGFASADASRSWTRSLSDFSSKSSSQLSYNPSSSSSSGGGFSGGSSGGGGGGGGGGSW